MYIVTPTEIPFVVWQGNLIAHTGRLIPTSSLPPVAALGQADVWPIEAVLETAPGQWTPPEPDTEYWLLRQGVQLFQHAPISNILEAQLTLYLRMPHDPKASLVYAHSLFPTLMNPEQPVETDIGLRTDLSFVGESGIDETQPHARITYRQVFPTLRGYGEGKCAPYWIFKPAGARALEGCQYVYLVAAIPSEAAQAEVEMLTELIVTINTLRGPLRFGLPSEARARARVRIPR
ncbi:MAG TPA: hypothetical protein PKH77_24305 [Anaerolineae bacterium]|nr:hypothetical protein [Anaerolineae bacterium]